MHCNSFCSSVTVIIVNQINFWISDLWYMISSLVCVLYFRLCLVIRVSFYLSLNPYLNASRVIWAKGLDIWCRYLSYLYFSAPTVILELATRIWIWWFSSGSRFYLWTINAQPNITEHVYFVYLRAKYKVSVPSLLEDLSPYARTTYETILKVTCQGLLDLSLRSH